MGAIVNRARAVRASPAQSRACGRDSECRGESRARASWRSLTLWTVCRVPELLPRHAQLTCTYCMNEMLQRDPLGNLRHVRHLQAGLSGVVVHYSQKCSGAAK
jgi:hypothetical protein